MKIENKNVMLIHINFYLTVCAHEKIPNLIITIPNYYNSSTNLFSNTEILEKSIYTNGFQLKKITVQFSYFDDLQTYPNTSE